MSLKESKLPVSNFFIKVEKDFVGFSYTAKKIQEMKELGENCNPHYYDKYDFMMIGENY